MRGAALLWLAVLLLGPAPIETASAADVAYRISERTHKQLSRVHELMGKGRYADALSRLNRMRARVEHKANEYALVLQTYGYVFTATERYQEGVDALERCLALEALPEPATRDTLYLLAQLQIAVTDYQAAIASLERWFQLQPDPTADAHVLAGTAYAQLKRYPQAVSHLGKAIALAAIAQENWYRQLLAVHYDSRQYQSAARLLQQMITRFPKNRDYWLHLSSVLRQLGDDSRSLAVMELAYLQGLLDRESDLVNLARYYLYMELPHRAGQLLEEALQEGTLGSTLDNWRLLTDAWLRAKETDRALAATERALALARDANLQLKRAVLLTERERWGDVVHSVDLALATDGLQSPGRAHILQGIAHYNLQQPAEAHAAFQRARRYDEVRNQAEQWIRYLQQNQPPTVPGPTTADLSH